MRGSNLKALLIMAMSALIVVGSETALAAKPPGTTNGTSLQASKTIDVCVNDDGSYTYSGVVSVWNEGAHATQGLSIFDCVQNKVSGPVWTDDFCQELNTSGTQIPAFTGDASATRFPYSATNGLLPGAIRNSAKVTILNHSGSIGTPRNSVAARTARAIGAISRGWSGQSSMIGMTRFSSVTRYGSKCRIHGFEATRTTTSRTNTLRPY